MLQILALLAISWLLIWLFEKNNLSVLGLTPTKNRIKYFCIIFIVSALFSASAFLLRIYFLKEEYILSPSLTGKLIALEIWYQFRTVVIEELLCRGALLYILIKKTGHAKAIFLSSVFFAMLHFINGGMSNNLIQILMGFLFTFSMGMLLAYAYARTFSLLIPFAIHYGWNLTQNFIFPGTALGNHLLVLAYPAPVVTISYVAFFTMLLFSKFAVLITDYLIVKQHVQVHLP